MAQTREQARQAERRRQERRAARQAVALQKRKMRTVVAATVSVLLVIGLVITLSVIRNSNSHNKAAAAAASASARATPTATRTASPTPPPVACGASASTPGPAQTFKAEPAMTIDTAAHYVATVATSCGTLSIDMLADKAPHTVNSWVFLASKKFYDGTRCHRMTSGGLNVLQCGDPTATGSGGPGYTIPEENLTGATYTKGTVAMAKTSAPHSTGSQFFIVYADSQLSPDYTVVGHVTVDSMAVLDKIAAIGVEGGGGDGPPAQTIYLDTVAVGKKG